MLHAALVQRTDAVIQHSMPAAERSWNTASAGTAPDTLPGELTDLEEHAAVCERRRGRLFAAGCAYDALHAFMAARFVTTLLIVAIVFVAWTIFLA